MIRSAHKHNTSEVISPAENTSHTQVTCGGGWSGMLVSLLGWAARLHFVAQALIEERQASKFRWRCFNKDNCKTPNDPHACSLCRIAS